MTYYWVFLNKQGLGRALEPRTDGAWLNELNETSKSAKQSGKGFVDDQLAGVAKVVNN